MMSGLPASGKTTVAKSLIEEVYPGAIRVSKDLISEMLHFGEFTPQNRKQVIELEKIMARNFLADGISVIVDDTNLGQRYEDAWKSIAVEKGALFIKATQTTDWMTCVERDFRRDKPVGEYTIKNFALEMGQVDGDFIICDLDGTLCDIKDRLHLVRSDDAGSEKNWKAFFENIPGDKLREEIANTVKQLHKDGFKIIYMSGRPEEYKQQTIEWLSRHGMDFNFSLIMRKFGDRRDDVIVKREMLNKYFKNRSQIKRVIDDRPKVVRMWKEELGDELVEDVGGGVEF